MYVFIQNAMTFVVGTVLFVFFEYGLAAIGYPVFIGGWPITLFFTLLFFVILALRVKIGLNVLFLNTVLAPLAFTFIMIFLGKVNAETSREILFSRGLPTLFGGVWVATLCVAIVMFACGLCAVLRDFRAWQKAKT
jgi:hypothetical protein